MSTRHSSQHDGSAVGGQISGCSTTCRAGGFRQYGEGALSGHFPSMGEGFPQVFHMMTPCNDLVELGQLLREDYSPQSGLVLPTWFLGGRYKVM